MSAPDLSQWRTVGASLAASLMLLGAFVIAIVLGKPDAGPLDLKDTARLYEYLSDAVVWLVVAVAAKSGLQHLGKGRGLAGAKAALLTDATPDEPPAAPPTAAPERKDAP